MLVSQLITGLFLIILGIVLTVIAFFGTVILLIYGLPLLVIGLIILFNKKEDQIEQINKRKGGKYARTKLRKNKPTTMYSG